MEKEKYYTASFSGGKDSTAMTLELICRGYPLNEVIFCDTTMEFPAMYSHVEKIRKIVESAGVKFTILRDPHGFEWWLADRPVQGRKEGSYGYGQTGYGWPSSTNRWCTKNLKTQLIDRHLRELQKTHELWQYIGLAADEVSRLERKNNQLPGHLHPLVEWGMTEADCLQYCYDRGYDWESLYEDFARVSCWCCPLQGLESMRTLRRKYPELWAQLLRMDDRQPKRYYTHYWSGHDVDRRFELEDALTAAGEKIRGPQFFRDLDRVLSGTPITAILAERSQKQNEE